ncbi:uncharacterized protein SPSC_04109 [Sporisorium scitamineum]|uniref:Uncharacterized protein n=1 Tax=Sporisorium scitamineum TaxID=49012 RepID=A0A127ZEQ9_9BASI|nr:uncharacterized protein SPSC_04109 [Sporisorium scitamineum]
MDGLGFIATLHATTLEDRSLQPMLLKTVKKPPHRVSNASTFDKAKSFVSKSKTLFSTSSSTSTAARTSFSSFRSTSSKSTKTSFASSRLPSQEQARAEKSSLPSPLSSVSFAEIASHVRPGILLCVDAVPRFDGEWYHHFVDKEYTFTHDSVLLSEQEEDMAWTGREGDVEPSRPSSTFERDLDFFDNCLEKSSKSQSLDLSTANQLACPLDSNLDPVWLPRRQDFRSKTVVRQAPFPQTRHLRARSISTTT